MVVHLKGDKHTGVLVTASVHPPSPASPTACLSLQHPVVLPLFQGAAGHNSGRRLQLCSLAKNFIHCLQEMRNSRHMSKCEWDPSSALVQFHTLGSVPFQAGCWVFKNTEVTALLQPWLCRKTGEVQ